jgi:hypothetical protein
MEISGLRDKIGYKRIKRNKLEEKSEEMKNYKRRASI